MMKTLLQYIVDVEGFEREIYKDSAGKSTIGVGHLLTLEERNRNSVMINGEYISFENGLTTLQVNQLLEQDLSIYEKEVLENIKVKLTNNQYIAVVSLCFNIGEQKFIESTLLKRLNNQQFDLIPLEFIKWIYANNKIDKGLIRRRVKDITMWLTGD